MPTQTLPVAAKAAEGSTLAQHLVFSLGRESFSVPVEHVREIIEFDGATPVPMMPEFLRGVINLRGSVVPVVDLQTRFGRAATEAGRRTCVVIVEIARDADAHRLGILVDAVNEVITVDPSTIEAKPSFGTGLRPDFVAGILNRDGRFVVILDMDQALSVDELAALAGEGFREREAVAA